MTGINISINNLIKNKHDAPADKFNENFMCVTLQDASCTSGNFIFNEESYNLVFNVISKFGNLFFNDILLTGFEMSF